MSLRWDRDGITTEADQRHVRGILKDLELERANHSASPGAVERRNEGNARSDQSKGENRCGQVQTQTKHEWDGMSDGDDWDRPHMADDFMRYRALGARISYLPQDRPDLKFASMQVCCAMAKPFSA